MPSELPEPFRKFVKAIDDQVRTVSFRRFGVMPPPGPAHDEDRSHTRCLGRQDVVVETITDVGDLLGRVVRQIDEFLEEGRIGFRHT